MAEVCGTMTRKRQACRRGFTLIELLVVISVISLLMAISLPAFHRARLIAKRTKCMANLRSIGQAMEAYLVVSKDYYPTASGYPILEEDQEAYCDPEHPSDDCLLPPIYEAIGSEIGHQRKVFLCPADKVHEPLEDRPSRDSYYASVGTSYEWDVLYNGKRVGHTYYERPKNVIIDRGLGWHRSEAPMINDYDTFHGGDDVKGSVVTLYADLHVAADRWTEPETEPGPDPDPDPEP